MRLLKYKIGGLANASRDLREVFLARDLGLDVTVCCRGDKGRYNLDERGGIEVEEHLLSDYRKNSLMGRVRTIVKEAEAVRAHADSEIVSCCNIVALSVAYLATRFKSPRPALVYDAHELEVARNVGGGPRGAAGTWAVARAERFLMRRAAFTIAVNDSIADEMQRLHAPVARPVVVRSTPPYWERDEGAVRARREELCARLGAGPDGAFLLMYHGAVCEGRGVEQVIRLVARMGDPQVLAVVMGDGGAAYLASLRSLAEGLGVSSRVLFAPAVPRDGLEAWVAAADVEMVVCEAVCKSYYYMLPNKFFEAVQAEVPLIVSDFPETSRLVAEYGIGAACDPVDMDALEAAVRRMRDDGAFYARCKANLLRAKADLCWEKERAVLEDAYRALIAEIEQ